jgi:hypothetical protein
LGTIKVAASAEAAAPKLEEMKTKLDGIRAAWSKLPAVSLSAIRQLIDAQMAPLKQKAEQIVTLPGISDRIKMLIQDILQRLTALATQPSTSQPTTTR